MKIKRIFARKIHNSRGEPAIEVIVNKKYSSSAPSGASTGKHEVVAFPKGIDFSIEFINKFKDFKGLRFEEFNDLGVFDELIPLIGGNAVVALQGAVLKAMANNEVWLFLNPKSVKLPIPLGNVVGGGAHTRKRNAPDIQEFLLIPKTKRFSDRVFLNRHLYHKIGKFLSAKNKTDEGAWIPAKMSDMEIFDKLSSFLSDKGNTFGKKVGLGIDLAASQLWNGRRYIYKNYSETKRKKSLTTSEQVEFINRIAKKYNLIYVEDGLREDDFTSFRKLKVKLNCGDDLITTNLDRLKQAVKQKSINTVIIKPNQIGSLVKAKEVVDFAHKNNITPVVSHRSGETMDTLIAHLAVGWQIPYIKCSPFGKERTVKFDELKRIESLL